MRTLKMARSLFKAFLAVGLLLILLPSVRAQETTGALQGTIKDPSGAVIAKAKVTVSTPTLVGTKSTVTDGKGYYRFANLPPGAYVITVEATGFAKTKQQGLILEVGHLPTADITLSVGSESTVVEVASANPAIDVTSVTTQSNITQDVINYVPRGLSFQSVIQFAPAASNEPLMGSTQTNGSGGTSPGSGTNGSPYGYSVAGGSDSENSYLVEGQETANLIGGYSHTNVPFDFISEVEIKTSGVQAEYGGALGGVVNVIMKKGTNRYHGSLFTQYETNGFDASPSAYPRYNPLGSPSANGFTDAAYQSYQPTKPHTSDVFPGFTFGGPLVPISGWRDKLFFFVGFNPEFNRYEQHVNFGTANGGSLPFSQNTTTYYTTARVDAQVTQKIRVFASYLNQFQKQYGENLPTADSTQGYYNAATGNPLSTYAHTLGYSAPNITFNTGADITINSHLVSTTRFGYYFENYHDFGYPTGSDVYVFETNGVGAVDATGKALPASLALATGTQSGPLDNLTSYNSNKAIQLDQSLAWYKSTGMGTHNFKFGYDLNRDSNLISQHYNEPYVQLFVGNTSGAFYDYQGPVGQANCATQHLNSAGTGCEGQYGYVNLFDYGTGGKAVSYNHSIFGQDSWTVGRGVTIDAGIRVEKEFLPGEASGSGVPANPIDFSWKDKIAPRIGVAWDVMRDGKLKIFGSYGVFNDQMKLNLAISSFGGQYWNNCAYALNTSNVSSINVAFDTSNRYCSGDNTSVPGHFSGATPTGLTFLENVNNRAATPTCSTCNPYEEAVAPNLKPYQQHDSVFGVDYQVSRTLSFEARWDRRRLDHVIEDSAIFNPAVGETFVIVNPGQGSDSTYLGFCAFLYSTDPSGCIGTTGLYPPPNTIPAARSYDGMELRLNKALSNHWFAMVSYTYSHFRGNYTGLTSSDLADGGTGGRNAPNNSRAFDEPYFSYNSFGGSSSGLLPTDRPNKFKGYAYYRLSYLHMTTDFGLFQTLYEGSPNTSYLDVGYSENAFPVDVVNRGKWVDITQNATTGAIAVGSPRTYRNPWYNQSDFQVNQQLSLGEGKSVSFAATFTNLLNEHSVTAVNEQMDSAYGGGTQYATPGGQAIFDGTDFYAAAENPYSLSGVLNSQNSQGGPITINSQYGKPLYYQLPRKIRLQLNYTF